MKPKFFKSSAELRDWFDQNHGSEKELLIGFYKKRSDKGGITYLEALDEALCFGWIDGVRTSIDEVSYMIRLTPRKPNSFWSAVNTKRANELVRLGRMKGVGLETFQRRDQERSNLYSYERATCVLDALYEKQFKRNREAWDFFQSQPPSYRRTATWWIMSAKNADTRLKRVAALIELSSKGERLDDRYRKKKRRKTGDRIRETGATSESGS